MTPSPSRSPLKYYLLVAALVLSVVPFGAAQASAATEKPTLLGIASLDPRGDTDDFAQEAGKPPAFFQLFWDLETVDWPNATWVPGLLSDLEDRGVTAFVEITTTSLDELNSGGQDTNLNAMAKRVGDWLEADSSRNILIAPLPEMNLIHAWGGDPAGYKAGYSRIRDAFLAKGLTPAQIRFMFAPNGTSDVGEYEDYYPGDSIVDVIGFAKINRGDPWRDYQVTFQEHIDELRSRVSLAKPILITQTGSVDVGGDKDKWLNDMFTGLEANDQVIGAVYFNRDKGGNDYRVLVNGSLDPTLNSGYQNWSAPSEAKWMFDGRMDTWVAERIEAFGSGFIDIAGHIFSNSIIWLAEESITAGCNPPDNTRFCPDETVTRGQMAVFIARALGLSAASDDYFDDDGGTFYESAANRLFEAGITVGCDTRRYCGDQQMTRGQMGSFLARTENLPPAGEDFFVDDNGSTFEGGINRIAQAGITVGCNPPANDRYCPGDFVTRGQMATFIKRALAG